MTGHDMSDQVAAYLLNALPEDEHDAFERHLESCGECQTEVRHLRVASDALPNSPIQLTPPPELKGRIMAIVNREAELLRAAGPEADRAPEPRTRERRRLALLRPGSWSLRPGLAVAATVLVLAIGAGGALVGESAFSGSDEPTIVQAEVGNAKLILRKDGHSTLVATGLDRPADGQVYQVWLKHKGVADPQPTNALFSSRSDGSASVDVPGSLKDVEQVLVTEEPDGGSSAPTSDPIIVATPA
jgi:anti-sigma-K factor RskA